MDEKALLTPLSLQILLSLAAQPRHGYAILQAITERTDGALSPGTGTLYAAIHRLEAERLITPADSEDSSDARRRYYRLTDEGADATRAELARLESTLQSADARTLLTVKG